MIQIQLKLETLNPNTIHSHKSLQGTAKHTQCNLIDFCNFKIKKNIWNVILEHTTSKETNGQRMCKEQGRKKVGNCDLKILQFALKLKTNFDSYI
jgi:hypothetical protein